MPQNVTDEWVALPAAERQTMVDRWWASLSAERQAEARQIGVGDELPYWLWRSLLPPQQRPTAAKVRSGQAVAVMPPELSTLIASQRPIGSHTPAEPRHRSRQH